MLKKNVWLKRFSIDLLRDQFTSIIDLLNDRNINYYIVGGALLGIVRSGDLLPWDKDTDLFIKSGDFHEFSSLMQELKNLGWQVKVESFSEDGPFAAKSEPRVIKISDWWLWNFRGPTRMDIDIIYSMDNYLCWNAAKRYSRIDEKFFNGNEVIEWNGRKLKVPNFYREFLTEVYGDWSVTIKNWSCKGDLTIFSAEKSVRGPVLVDQFNKNKHISNLKGLFKRDTT
mgnify:CR=1 FL=1